jgi:hypothetical protein
MLLQAVRVLRARPLLSIRPFSTSLLKKAEGDTGSIRAGGNAHADTWSRREKAAEDMYIREREKEIMCTSLPPLRPHSCSTVVEVMC